MSIKNDIIKLRKEGKNYNDISKILNCSKGTISYHCKNIENNNDLSYLNKQRKNINQIKKCDIIDFGNIPDDEKIKDVIFFRKTKNNYDEIAEKTGLSLDKIKKICKVYKLDNQSKSQSPTEYEINEMKKYYLEVKSLKKVAKKFKCCYKTVRKYINPIGKYSNSEEYEIKRKKNISINVVKWRQDKKIKLVEYKGGSCQICNYNKSIGALEFHHLDPNEKDFNISGKSYSYEKMKNEVDKCILVCSNCHIEIHEEIRNNGYSEIIINKILTSK
jgi:DNA-binding CsgD family transcriptional regulator